MLRKRLIALLAAAVFLFPLTITGCGKSKSNEEANTSNKIVAYYPNWAVYGGQEFYSPDKLPWDKVTHINYAFAVIGSDNKIISIDPYADLEFAFKSGEKGALNQFMRLAKEHPKTQTLISVGGYSQSAAFHEAALTDVSRLQFAQSCVDFIRKWDFDGVDIDWEYPTIKREPNKVADEKDTGTSNADAAEKKNFTLLLKTLRNELDKAGEKDGKRYLLTAAIGANKNQIDGTEPEKYIKYLDFVNVMTYDYAGTWMNTTSLQTALKADPKEPAGKIDSSLNVENTLKLLEKDKVPKNKLVIGTPFYSRGWKGVKNDGPIKELPGLYASAEGGAMGIWDGGIPGGVNPFYYIKDVLEKDSSFVKYREPNSQAPYLYSESKQEFYTYEDEVSLQAKVDYINQNKLGGIVVWEATGDYPHTGGTTLIDILYNGLYPGKTGK